MVIDWSATTIVAERVAKPVASLTVNLIVPLPTPDAPDVNKTNGALDVAVKGHPGVVVTLIDPIKMVDRAVVPTPDLT